MACARRATIAGRLYLVGGLAIASIAAIATVSIYFAVVTRRAADVLYEGGLVKAVEAGQIELLLERHRRVIEAAPLEFDRAQIRRDRIVASNLMLQVEELVGRSHAEFSSGVKQSLPGLRALGAEVLRLAENFAQDRALSVVESYAKEAERLQESIREHRKVKVKAADNEARALASSAGNLVHAVMFIALIASVVIGPFAVMMLRNMIRRLEHVTAAMRRLANNDTNVAVDGLASNDEIGEMAKAVAVFKDNAVQVQELNRWLDVALNNMARGLSMYDGNRRLIVCNAAYARMYALPDELTRPGVPFDLVLDHRRKLIEAIDGQKLDERVGAKPALERLIAADEEGQIRQQLSDGRTIEISVKPLEWGGWLALHEDVTDRFAAAERISRLAQQDTLTGLANRHHFKESLEAATASLAKGASFALFAIDLDRFKEVNDTFGHPAGDALLSAVGQRLSDLVRRDDVVARLGGDEFAIIQRGASERDDAEALAKRVIQALHQPFQLPGQRVEIGGTVGIALAPTDAMAAEDLMRNADLALYRAKGERKGTWCFFDSAMEGRIRARRALEFDLAKAVTNGELVLHYQPIISLEKRRVEGCEALIRWQHPGRGMVSPAEFIPLAEETGHIAEIGAWALREACRAAARWGGDMRVGVNLSVAQFNGPDLVAIAREALAASKLEAARLELEVTETLLLGDDPATLEVLHGLREQGISIALDDFGTGYSSLSHLRSFPFDKIKIDQTFVRDLPQRRNCEAIVGAVARLASSLEMTTVAEGVETAEHLRRVRAAGCDLVQGYLFSKPVAEAELCGVVEEIDRRLATDLMAA